jgi:predicted methyltransferase
MRKTLITIFALTLSVLAPQQSIRAEHHAGLGAILAAQPDEARARYNHRHPQETLEFFGIEPGMTVVDTLPGSVWYAGILLSYLGSDGTVIGADYAIDLWPLMGYDGEEFLEERKSWATDWTAKAESWGDVESADVSAFVLGSLPDSMHGTADAVLFVRALHNMAYTTPDARHLKAAIKDAHDILKSGGIVGIVQHHARDNMSDKWSNGANGYLKKGFVIDTMEAAGFELVDESDINANSKDMPTEEQYVWRLPPSYDGAPTPEAKAAVDAIGESNRMTLKFRKP